MTSSTTTSQAGRTPPSHRTVRRGIVLAVAAVILGLVGFVHVVHGREVGLKLCAKHGWALGDTFVDLDDYGDHPVSNSDNVEVLGAMFQCGALRRPAHDDAEASRQRGPSPTEQGRAARPALPPALPTEPAQPTPAEPALAHRHLPAAVARQLTENKVQQYAHQAYPAWRRAHPGQECPQRLTELNEYMDDKDDRNATDAKDAWGRSLKMFCSPTRPAGAKRIKVTSLGRDAERGTEDDITAEE